eukprot:3218955-Prymnesium_polylepis.1
MACMLIDRQAGLAGQGPSAHPGQQQTSITATPTNSYCSKQHCGARVASSTAPREGMSGGCKGEGMLEPSKLRGGLSPLAVHFNCAW